jgi:acetyl esterase/lipase
LTHSHFSTAIQVLPGGRLVFSQNSLAKPNDVHILQGLDKLGSISSSFDTWTKDTQQIGAGTFMIDQLTSFTESSLKPKNIANGEEFWFVGAEGKRLQGWILKPNGWSAQDKKKWPVVLIIHGGPQGAWEDNWSTRWNPNGAGTLALSFSFS